MPLFHPSGGLIYHVRAWRWRHRLWTPFHAQVRTWLAAWQPPAGHLVLVGPSGGYALDSPFLARFRRLTVLEPDGLARALLQRRFPGIAFDFANTENLTRRDGFQWLARQYPDAAFLFCNLLGQEPAGQEAGFDRGAWLAGLEPALAGRSWASWHDLASTQRPPDRPAPLGLDRAESLEALLPHFWLGGELAIHDHGCAGLAPGAPRQYALWKLRPDHYHLVEWLVFP